MNSDLTIRVRALRVVEGVSEDATLADCREAIKEAGRILRNEPNPPKERVNPMVLSQQLQDEFALGMELLATDLQVSLELLRDAQELLEP